MVGESLIKLREGIDALRIGVLEMASWPIGMFASVGRERDRWAKRVQPYCDSLIKAMGPSLAPR